LTPIASSAPTAARPPARPSACHSKIAAAGDLRGQEARNIARALRTHPPATAASSTASASALIIRSRYLLLRGDRPRRAHALLWPPVPRGVLPPRRRTHSARTSPARAPGLR